MGRPELDFHRLVEAIREYAIIRLDPAGIVCSWNTGAQRMKGWTAEEVIGQHVSIFYQLEDVAAGKPMRELELALNTDSFEHEGWRIRRDGSVFWANVVLTAVCSPSGQRRGFVNITRDLTAQKQAEEAARHMALLDQRETIGAEILTRTVTSLFGIGMSVQAIALQSDADLIQRRLEDAIDDIDGLITELRLALYQPSVKETPVGASSSKA